MSSDALRIGQFTGFHGDRLDGMSQLIEAGVDFLVGDYLAELTMLVLAKRAARGGTGYVSAFVELLESCLGQIAESGTKVVTNAGGLDPRGCAEAISRLFEDHGIDLRVAWIEGDDLREYLGGAGRAQVRHLGSGEKFAADRDRILTANAYTGAFPIVTALDRGADIVICPRTADASLVVGPAAWAFDWSTTDYDRLAAGVVVGHIIECGAQATGGNYSFFDEYDDLGWPGLPIAEFSESGSAVVTKPRDSGGVVTVDTIKAQLFYEIGSEIYLNPDCGVDLRSVHVEEVGPDRVGLTGVRGLPPRSTTKASITYEGGFRNAMTFALTGGRQEQKLKWLERQLATAIGPPDSFDGYRLSVIGPADPAGSYEASTTHVILSVRDRAADRVSRTSFSDPIVQLGLSSYPGFYMTTPPQRERLYGIQWPALVPKAAVSMSVSVLGEPDRVAVPWPRSRDSDEPPTVESDCGIPLEPYELPEGGEVVEAPLWRVAGARSGDKGGDANVGIWVRNEETYRWLAGLLTVDAFIDMLPEARQLTIDRYDLPNLLGLNFVVRGFLDDGVSSSLFIDPQAKGLGEFLLSRRVKIPRHLLGG